MWVRETILVYRNPFSWVVEHLQTTWRMLNALVNPATDVRLNQMSGPPGIAYAFLQLAIDYRLILWFAILLNVNLAILNLLPIPVLDGGHIVFATVAKLRGKPVPINWIASLQGAFMLLLLGVMFYVMYFDVRRIGRDVTARVEEEAEAAQRIAPVFEEPAEGR
jgi:regulator of sigma E protease